MTSDMSEAEKSIRLAFGHDVEIDAHEFSSGAVSITVRHGGHAAVIDAIPPDEWAISIDPADAQAFGDHDHVATSLADAVRHLRRSWPTS
jgi:hypothetical protein